MSGDACPLWGDVHRFGLVWRTGLRRSIWRCGCGSTWIQTLLSGGEGVA